MRLVILIQELIDLEILQLIPQFQICARLRTLLFQRSEPRGKLIQNVLDAFKVLLGMIELSRRLFLTHTVTHHAGGFFKRGASFVGLIGQDLVHASL